MQVKKQQLELDMEQQTGSKLEKEYIKAVYCHPAYLNLCAEYVMWNARLDEARAGIKIAVKNINNLRYTDDTTLMTESEEELKSLLIKVKEEGEWQNWLKTQHSKNKDHGIQSYQFSSVQFSRSVMSDSLQAHES